MIAGKSRNLAGGDGEEISGCDSGLRPANTPNMNTRISGMVPSYLQLQVTLVPDGADPLAPSDPGRSGKNNRLFVEAVLWIARTGSPWRDLPAAFGHWNSIFTRFRDWAKADVWKRLFEAVSDDPDMEYAMIDATIVKVHRHGQGAKGGLKTRPSAARKAA